MKFYVYDVRKQNSLDVKYLGHEIKECLDQLKKVGDRLMSLNKEESGDFDFISQWHFSKSNVLFCSLVRLKKGVVSAFTEADYTKDSIPLDKIMTNTETASSFKEAIFFAIYKNCIVITSHNAKVVRNHLLWLLEKCNNTYRFEIDVQINQEKTIELGNVKEIRLGESYLNQRNISSGKQSFKFLDIKNQFLQCFLDPEIIDLYGDLISASLLLKFNKKKITSADAAKFALNLVEDEAIKLKSRDGKTYSGADIREVEEHEIEKTSEGAYNIVDIQNKLTDMLLKYVKE